MIIVDIEIRRLIEAYRGLSEDDKNEVRELLEKMTERAEETET